MNIERYVWPVIIAVSLHGLLLFSFFDSVVIYPHGKTKDPTSETPVIDRIEMMLEDSNQADAAASGGGPEPLPQTPDIPRELSKEDIFRVEVTEVIVPIKPIIHLTKIPEGVGRPPGDGPELRGGPRGIIDHTRLDRAPRATVQPAPSYPYTMRSSGTSGSVTVEFVVDTTGRVVTADAVRWTHREFVDPAVRAVMRWRFEAGTAGGRKVSFRMAVPIEFNAAN